MIRPSLARAREVLQRYFGYPDFRPAQLPAIEAILSRRDAVTVLPTGGGKSICFQVPALCFEGLTVVISPLISLMSDQVQALERRGVGATFLNSTLTPDESSARTEKLRRGEVRLLYVAPERLAMGSTADLLRRAGVSLLAVDEAHCVSEWGQDFRPSYLKLPAIRRLIGDPQTVALTATATPRVRRDIARLLELRDPIVIVGGFDRPNLAFRVERVDSDGARHQSMVRHIRAERDPAVVYAATRRQVEEVARILASGGVRAVPYHAGLPPERRARAQDAFMTGEAPVIVATNAFGMGIDKPNVRLVLHVLHSGSLEDYYQEAGRAGRDGVPSRCLLLFHPLDRHVHDRMREQGWVSGEDLRRVWERLGSQSGGRRHIPLDARTIASSLGTGVEVETVDAAFRVLEERGVLRDVCRPDTARLRLLASPLRIECERASLTADARLVLEVLVHSSGAAIGFVPLSINGMGLTVQRFEASATELESRQLIHLDRAPSRAIVDVDFRSRARLERLIRDRKVRSDVERAKLNSMVAYASTLMCRRRFILTYFGERTGLSVSCRDCDVCDPGE